MDSKDFLSLIKQASMEAVNASKPANISYGKVVSVSPLQIQTEQKITLTATQLVLTRNVTDYDVEMTVSHTTGDHTHTHTIEDTYTGGGTASSVTHHHAYTGKKTFRIHNALKAGETVILMQVAGGQKFVILDRM